LKLTIIANNFQKNYTESYIYSIAKFSPAELFFIGSTLYDINEKQINKIDIRFNKKKDLEFKISFLTKAINLIIYYIKLIKYALKNKDSKVFHFLWYRFPFFEGIILNLVLIILGKKIVYTVHNNLPHEKNNLFIRLIFNIIYIIPHKLIVLSDYVEKKLITTNKFLNNQKIVKTSHGLYIFKNNFDTDFSKIDKFYNINNKKKFIFLLTGGISRYKGIEFIIDFISSYFFTELIGKVEFLIVGKSDHSYFESLKKRIKQSNESLLSSHLTIRNKYLSENQMISLLKYCHSMVLPYTEATQSGVMFLSYTFGLPVLASDVGAFFDDIEDGITGYIFKKNNYEDFKNKIIMLINNKEIQNRKKLTNYTNQKYSIKNVYSKVFDMYLNLNKA